MTPRPTKPAPGGGEESLQAAIIDALPAHIALTDAEGVILAVNAPWRRFATDNGLQGRDYCVGANYLEVCVKVQGPGSAEAKAAAEGMRSVLRGETDRFSLEYPCHSPTEQRWFRLMVTPLRAGRRAGVVVMHVDISERRRVELALQGSEQEQRGLVEELEVQRSRLIEAQAVAKVGSWETDLATMNVKWTQETHRIFETDPAKFSPTHRDFIQLVHPDDRARVDAAFFGSISQSGAKAIEHRVLLPDGRIKLVEERWQVFSGPEGRPVRAVGTCQDISERRSIEQRAADEHLFTHTILENSPLAIITYRASGEAVTANPASVRMLGAPSLQAVVAQNFRQIEVWQRTGLREAAERALADDRACEREIRTLNSFGKEVWLHCRLMPFAYAGERYLLGFFDDIRERKLAEEKVLRSESLQRMASRIARLGGWTIDLPGRELFWSEEICAIHELPPGHKPTLEEGTGYFLPEHRAEVHRLIDACATEGTPYEFELPKLTAKGRRIWVHSIGEAVRDTEGRIVRLQGAMQDITDRKLAEEEMRLANETLEGIVATLKELPSSGLDLAGVMNLMTARAQELTGGTGAAIKFVEDHEMVCRAASGTAAGWIGMRLPRQGSLSGLAVETGGPLVCDDAETDARVDPVACRQVGARSMVSVPLRDGEQNIGALKVLSDRPRAFAPRDVANLQILVESFGSVIQRRIATERLRASEAQYRMLFASNPHPMWVYDLEDLRFLAVNKAAVLHYGYSEAEFLTMTILDLRSEAEAVAVVDLVAGLQHLAKNFGRWRHRKKDGSIIDVDISSDAVELNGRRARLVLAHDVTERVRSDRELARANRALKMLSLCNEALIRADSESGLLTAICRTAVQVGGFRMAWVGYARDDAEKSIEPQAHAGEEAGYLTLVRLNWREDHPGGHGPAGRTIRTGQPTVVLDLTSAESGFQSVEEAAARGYHGVVCLPLQESDGHTFGVFALYLPEVREVPPEELALLRELAEDLAFGIVNLRARLERRRNHAAVLTMARGISASIGTAFFEQLARSMVEALGADAGFIARLVPGGGRAETIAAVVDGRTVPNFGYDLAGTPCEELDRNDTWVVPQGARARYGQARDLETLGIEAYVGTRLTGSGGRPIGLMFVQFRQPLEKHEFATSTLKIFAARAAAELERQDADARTREQAALLDKAQDAILVRDLEHRVSYWNKSAERLYGWKAEAIQGRSVRDLLYTDATIFDQAMQQLLADGEWVGELPQVRQDGKLLTIEGHWTLLRDETGRPKSVLAINTDITERKKLEEQFLRAQRMESIGTLAGGIAHDLNNLLAPISMGVELLRQYEPSERSQRMINTIERSAKRGAELVKQVLTFARGVEGVRVAVHPRHIVNEVVGMAENTFPKNIRIEADVPRDLAQVIGDPTQLNQVLLNLCVNARDAMPSGGRLAITVSNVAIDEQYAVMNRGVTPGPYVMIEVADNGCGIPQPVIDRIFEPFFTTKEIGKGTGLGLSTVQAIARSHGGFVNVYSEEGRGSTFKVYLPALADGSAADAAASAEERLPRGNGELVLLVDDESPILDVTGQTLEAFGYATLKAEDGAQAIALYASHRDQVAVVLTDMMMPVMDGPALIAALRRIDPKVLVIAASGLDTNANAIRAATIGVKHFLAKPYSADAMLRLLKTVLAEKRGGSKSRNPF